MRSVALCAIALTLAACKPTPAKIVIKLPKDSIEASAENPVLPPFTEKNANIKLRASSFDERGVYMGNAIVSWSSSDPSVAVINGDGLVTILSSGKATIKAELAEPKLEATFDVSASIPKRIKITPPEEGLKEIKMGVKKTFKATVYDDKDQVIPDAKVTWRTNGYAATVAVDGEIEGRATGETQIVAEHRSLTDRYDLRVLDW